MTSMILSALPTVPVAGDLGVIEQLNAFFAQGVSGLIKVGLFMVIGILAIRVISFILSRILARTNLPKALAKVSVRLIDAGLWLLFAIGLLQTMGLTNVAFAISGAFAVFALGISNGLTATVTDTISGLNLARDRHFRIGDRVIAGDRKTEGVIIDLDMRKARLKSDDEQIHVIPNSLIDKNEFILVERAGQVETAKPRKVVKRPAVLTRATKTKRN